MFLVSKLEIDMQIINIHQAKTQLSKLIEKVLVGEDVIIAKAGKPIVKLTPYKEILKDPRNRIFVSVATAWEISIKQKKGKLPLKTTLEECFRKSNFEILEIKLPHILQLENLPTYHKDPFDRILVAQAIVEKLMIITEDGKIKKYDVSVLG